MSCFRRDLEDQRANSFPLNTSWSNQQYRTFNDSIQSYLGGRHLKNRNLSSRNCDLQRRRAWPKCLCRDKLLSFHGDHFLFQSKNLPFPNSKHHNHGSHKETDFQELVKSRLRQIPFPKCSLNYWLFLWKFHHNTCLRRYILWLSHRSLHIYPLKVSKLIGISTLLTYELKQHQVLLQVEVNWIASSLFNYYKI